MLSLRRRHSRWRMFPIFLFLGLICSAELAPARLPEEISSAPSSSSTPKKKDIDFLGDFWQALLLVDPQSGFQPSLDSRRITPKSVFIAPGVLPACAEGYHADKMGRCVKSISINATAHKDFLLERLKLMFSGVPTVKSDQKKSTGPLQLNIPLQLNPAVSDIDPQPTEIEVEETFLKNQPVAAPTRNGTYFSADQEKTKLPMTLYELKNDTTLDEEEFFFGNSNVDDIGKKLPATVPVTELVEETNDTNFSEVVDYKIPVDLKTALNSSGVKRIDISGGDTEESVLMTEKRESSTESSPALVLLISPTKLTNVVDDLSLTQNDAAEEVVQMSNFTSNANESVTAGVPDPELPAKQTTSIPTDEQRDNETYVKDELALETSKPSEETDFLYDEEEGDVDYPYSTDVPADEDDSAEGEEILKHGEAGMTIPTVRDIERQDRDRHQRQQDQIAELKKLFNTFNQIVDHNRNDSAPTEDKDEAGSNVSSEVSIDGDFIVETTLLDVNTERLQVTTKSPDMTEEVKDSGDESKNLFSSETKSSHVIFPDDVHDVVTVSSHGREPTEQLSMRFENEKNKELESASSSYDSPEEYPITEIRTINDKRLKESILQKSPKDFESNVPSSSIRSTMNLDSAEDFVRFPDYVRRPQQGGYVRFPDSGEIANSIHSLNYKQNSRYSADDVGPYGGTSTKSSVPVRQKPVYHLMASSWKSDLDRVQATPSERQNQTPDLMHFWSKLPLIKDPAIYPVDQNNDQEQSYSRSFRARSSRRLSPFTETSPGNRVSTQKRKTPISV